MAAGICRALAAACLLNMLAIPGVVKAQPWQTEGEIMFWVDAVPFRGQGDATGLEIIYRGGADQLSFEGLDGEYRAWVQFSVEIVGPGDARAAKQWSVPVGARDEVQTARPDMYIVESLVADLHPGIITLSTSVRDSLSGRVGTVQGELEVPSYAESSLSVSGAIFASRVGRGGEGPYYKGGYDMLPEPSRRFGPFLPVLYVYHETYNLSFPDTATPQDVSGADRFAVWYTVSTPDGAAVKHLPPDTLQKPGSGAARVAGLSVAGLQPGAYVLGVEVEDLGNGERARREAHFWVVDQEAAPLVEVLPEGPALSEEDQELLEALVVYLGTKDEKSLYKGLSPKAQASFLLEFSRRRVSPRWPTPEAYLEEQRARFRHVNADFGGFRRGWESDPGRVYMVYGPPDEVERYAAQTDRKDHQIWQYYTMGGIIFIFVDESGYGNYRLIHSTAKGELRNDDWQDEVFILPTW